MPTDKEIEAAALGIMNATRKRVGLRPLEWDSEFFSPYDKECALPQARAALTAAEQVRASEWQPIETAKKDGSRILLKIKNPVPREGRDDLRPFDGLEFVGRHPGLADDGFDIGWNFAAPVGWGGFPDDWLVGWMPLPVSHD